jgi:hypothetical protein
MPAAHHKSRFCRETHESSWALIQGAEQLYLGNQIHRLTSFAVPQNQGGDDLVPGKSFDGGSNADYCPPAKVLVDTRNSCTNYAGQFEF